MGLFRRSSPAPATPTPPRAVVESARPTQKNAALCRRRDELKERIDGVLAYCSELETARDAAYRAVFAAQAEAKFLGDRIATAKTPQYRDECNEYVALCRALSPKNYGVE